MRRNAKDFMSPLQFITSLLQHATAEGSRSTVLRPLSWLAGICVVGLLGCLEFKAPDWITDMFAVMIALAFLLFIGAYIYCLMNDREALRSEKYSIQRLAIEKGLLGDSTSGMFRAEDLGSGLQLAEQSKAGELK